MDVTGVLKCWQLREAAREVAHEVRRGVQARDERRKEKAGEEAAARDEDHFVLQYAVCGRDAIRALPAG